MRESEYEELLSLLDRLIVNQEDRGTHPSRQRADRLAEAYQVVQDCQKADHDG